MAFFDIALLATDDDFRQRVAACVSTEDPGRALGDPFGWAIANQWTIAGAPGFGDAYASALAGDVEHPGRDPSVISDAQILAAVQALIAEAAA